MNVSLLFLLKVVLYSGAIIIVTKAVRYVYKEEES